MREATVLSRFLRHRPAVGSVVVIALLGLGAGFAGGLRLPDPIQIQMGHKFAPPLSQGHVLGADEHGGHSNGEGDAPGVEEWPPCSTP